MEILKLDYSVFYVLGFVYLMVFSIIELIKVINLRITGTKMDKFRLFTFDFLIIYSYMLFTFPCLGYTDNFLSKFHVFCLLPISFALMFLVTISIFKDNALKAIKNDLQKIVSRFIRNPNYLFIKGQPITYGVFIYFWFLCWWGNLYFFITKLGLETFTASDFTLLDAIYFSFITAFTIGYGDYFPRHELGKVLVMAEIFLNFILVVTIIQKSLELKEKT